MGRARSKRQSGRREARRDQQDRADRLLATRNPNLNAQNRKILQKHYANKYRTR
jgi:hypothetical protein